MFVFTIVLIVKKTKTPTPRGIRSFYVDRVSRRPRKQLSLRFSLKKKKKITLKTSVPGNGNKSLMSKRRTRFRAELEQGVGVEQTCTPTERRWKFLIFNEVV